jgi:predicted aspartyl protease
MVSRPRLWSAAAASLLALASSAFAETPVTSGIFGRLAPSADPHAISASHDAAERMTVPVLVDGQGPFPFVIDTGADRTVISRELADSLGLQAGEPVRLNGVAGVDVIPTARISDLLVGPRSTRDVLAPTLTRTNLGAAGMLGIDSLRDQRIVLDFQHNVLAVQPSRPEHYGPDVIVVRAKSRYGQLVLVDASIAGVPIAVIVDSGAENTIGNAALARLVGADWNAKLPVDVVSVSGRTLPAHFANLPRVKVGGASLNHLPIAFAKLHTFEEFGLTDTPAMLLGMDVMRHFDRVVIDFGRKQVSFQTPL